MKARQKGESRVKIEGILSDMCTIHDEAKKYYGIFNQLNRQTGSYPDQDFQTQIIGFYSMFCTDKTRFGRKYLDIVKKQQDSVDNRMGFDVNLAKRRDHAQTEIYNKYRKILEMDDKVFNSSMNDMKNRI